MKCKYKLLSIDLDGTLLTKFKRITKKDLLSLYNYSAAGGNILINTGKSLQSTYRYMRKLQTVTKQMKYCSCLNGNLIYDINKEEVIYYNSIMAQDCKKIFDIVRSHKKRYMCYEVPQDPKHIKLEDVSHLKVLKDRYCQTRYYNKVKNPDIKSSYKINVIGFPKPIGQDIVADIKAATDVKVIQTNDRLFEIVNNGSNKGTSLTKITNMYGFKQADVASIGDSNNDLEMFKASGAGFLVKKRPGSELEKAASQVVPSRKNKVSKVINNYILK